MLYLYAEFNNIGEICLRMRRVLSSIKGRWRIPKALCCFGFPQLRLAVLLLFRLPTYHMETTKEGRFSCGRELALCLMCRVSQFFLVTMHTNRKRSLLNLMVTGADF